MSDEVEVAMNELETFDYAMSTRGWVVFESVVAAQMCSRLRDDIGRHVDRCGHLQEQAGIEGAPDGTAHHTVGYDDSLDEFIAAGYLHEYIDRYFGGSPYILHAVNPVTVAPARSSYVHRMHKDVRTHTGGFRLLINMLVMVDGFTLENGATYILSGSHHSPLRPDEEFFDRHAERIVGPAGSIVLFDSNVWHRAGLNTSGSLRSALTLSMSRAFVKPQMDYARLLGTERGERLSAHARQVLGYNAGVANSLDEWYRPRDQRLYRGDQG